MFLDIKSPKTWNSEKKNSILGVQLYEESKNAIATFFLLKHKR
jgi:hypothetical protein